MARVGMVEYINALPFHLPFRLGEIQSDHTFTYGTPRDLNAKLHAGELDMALTSSTEYFQGNYRLMPGFCLGAHKEIMSVNLYIRGPLDKARIGVTSHSASSLVLLKVLCHHFWKAEPSFSDFQENETYDGYLLIGDEALKKKSIPGYQTIDLAAAWYEATGLPFVFAVMSAKEGAASPEKDFEAALEWSERNRERLVEAAHAKIGLPKALIERYYDLCKYRLTEKELEGLQLFQRLSTSVSKVFA